MLLQGFPIPSGPVGPLIDEDRARARAERVPSPGGTSVPARTQGRSDQYMDVKIRDASHGRAKLFPAAGLGDGFAGLAERAILRLECLDI